MYCVLDSVVYNLYDETWYILGLTIWVNAIGVWVDKIYGDPKIRLS